jgi:PQQ-like domain
MKTLLTTGLALVTASLCPLAAAQLGQELWEFETGGGNSSPAIGADGTVYVTAGNKSVYALDGATGQKLWDFYTGDVVNSSPAIGADGTVYVQSMNGKLCALGSRSIGGVAQGSPARTGMAGHRGVQGQHARLAPAARLVN